MLQEVTPVALFPDRCTAGAQLAARLASFTHRKGTLVLALPPNGVPVACEVATRLALPLDLIIVRKLCAPGERGLAMGAVTTGGIRIINHDTVRMLGVSQFALEAVEAEERAKIEEAERALRGDWPPPEIAGRPVIVVAEGLATGATMHWAAKALRRLGAAHITAAAPIASRNATELVEEVVDTLVVIEIPDPYISSARWYESHPPVGARDIVHLLERATVAYCRAGNATNVH